MNQVFKEIHSNFFWCKKNATEKKIATRIIGKI